MDLDDIFRVVGEYGKYQKLMLWFVLLPSHLPFGTHYYSQLFMSLTPSHWCHGGIAHIEGVTAELPPNATNSTYRMLTMWSRGWENPASPTVAECSVGPQTLGDVPPNGWVSNMTCEFDRSEINGEDTVVTTWNLVCDLAWLPSAALSVFFFGAFVGQWMYILFTNRFGRRASFFAFLAVQCAFGVAADMAPDFASFAGLRFFVGLSSAAAASSPASLAQELVGPSQREQSCALSATARSLGPVFLSGVVFLVRDWSHVSLVTTLPFLAFFLYWWVFPESPEWLRGQGRYEEVGRLFEVIAQANGRELPPDYIINLKRRFRIEGSMLEDRRRDGRQRRYGLWDLFSSPNMRNKTTAIAFIWLTSTTSSVGLSLYSVELWGDPHLHFFLCAGAELAAALFLGVAGGRFCGRRCHFCLGSALGGALTLSIANSQTGSTSRLTMFVVAKLSISSSSIVLPLWTKELLPIVVRTVGLQMVDVISLLGPIALPLLFNQGRQSPGIPLLTLGSLQVAGAVVALLLPETVHQKALQSLEDGEQFGKHRTWMDYFRIGPPKQEAKNGILKNRGPQQQSPILSLLRRQDSLRRASSEGEQDHSDPQSESSTEQGPLVETVKITVV